VARTVMLRQECTNIALQFKIDGGKSQYKFTTQHTKEDKFKIDNRLTNHKIQNC